MKKATGIKVVLAKFGTDPQEVVISKDSTVGEFLTQEGITLKTGEKIWVNGERATAKDVLEAKDVVNIVASKEGGLK